MVKSSPSEIPGYDFIVKVAFSFTQLKYATETRLMYVKMRPGLCEFLSAARKNFELFVYTASSYDYAHQVLDFIEKRAGKSFVVRLSRESCVEWNNSYVKDLHNTNRDFAKIIFVDVFLNFLFRMLLNPFHFSLRMATISKILTVKMMIENWKN